MKLTLVCLTLVVVAMALANHVPSSGDEEQNVAGQAHKEEHEHKEHPKKPEAEEKNEKETKEKNHKAPEPHKGQAAQHKQGEHINIANKQKKEPTMIKKAEENQKKEAGHHFGIAKGHETKDHKEAIEKFKAELAKHIEEMKKSNHQQAGKNAAELKGKAEEWRKKMEEHFKNLNKAGGAQRPSIGNGIARPDFQKFRPSNKVGGEAAKEVEKGTEEKKPESA